MSRNPVRRLNALGQSPWLDYLSRDLVRSGELDRLIERWGLGGLTSNPAIFEKAIVHSDAYDADIRTAASAGASPAEIYESLVLDDVRRAADAFAPVYAASRRRDGYVSVEVSPHLVDDSAGTVAEAKRLWNGLSRPNVMIKVPGTTAGLAAIEDLTAAGINVNVTLLFSLRRYTEAAQAFLSGLERAARSGLDLAGIASVASFFLSRIDTLVDEELDGIMAGHGDDAVTARGLRGRAAIAAARRAYRLLLDMAASQRFLALEAQGAGMQRLLWASTGTKNPAYDDIKYVEPLIGPRTVSTMPLETLEAYERSGRPATRLSGDATDAEAVLDGLAGLGLDIEQVAERLLAEGIRKFVDPYDATHRAIEKQCTA